MYCNYSCHVSPLYEHLDALNQSDFHRLEFAQFVHKLHRGALPRSNENFFKTFLVFILTKPDSLATKK